jgi:hypothetical protein
MRSKDIQVALKRLNLPETGENKPMLNKNYHINTKDTGIKRNNGALWQETIPNKKVEMRTPISMAPTVLFRSRPVTGTADIVSQIEEREKELELTT